MSLPLTFLRAWPETSRRLGLALLVLGAVLPPVGAAVAETAPPAADGTPLTPPAGDANASSNAARSRLRECGHQWSSMKKTGSAAGMTWKDYSRSCLAKQ